VAFQPKRGATLLIPSGPSGSHLFVVVTDEVDGQFLLVSLSSIKPNRYYDSTCVVAAGVHEFVTLDSFGFYGGARLDVATHLTAMEGKGLFFAKADMPLSVVQALCDGIEVSPHTPRYILNFYRKYLDGLG
jgi:hypothetical protein